MSQTITKLKSIKREITVLQDDIGYAQRRNSESSET